MNKVFQDKALQDTKELLLRRLKEFSTKIEEMSEEDFARYNKLNDIFETSMALAENDSYFAELEDELHKEEPNNREIAILTFIQGYGNEPSKEHSKFSVK